MRKTHPEVIARRRVFERLFLAIVFLLSVTAVADDCSEGCKVVSRDGHFHLVARPVPEKPPLREYHDWTVEVQDVNGSPVDLAGLSVTGGMPGHGHGLPSQPKVNEYLGGGRYRISGFLFNMHGEWTLRFHLAGQNLEDVADLTLTLDY